jgi:hypothetical protein
MERDPVTSSSLASVGYDARYGMLEVEFNNGEVYQYGNVPEYVYEDFNECGLHRKLFCREYQESVHAYKDIIWNDTQIGTVNHR